MQKLTLLAILALATLLHPLAASANPTLYIIGDSTVHNPLAGLEGWGDAIGAYFDPTKITVENDAIGGRSSRSFLTEGHWDKVLAKIQPGDFVIMQFGHNDGGAVVGGSGRASIHGVGDQTRDVVDPKTGKTETVHTYGWYMTKYVEDAKAKGAFPIIVSPIPRNMWSPTGTIGRNVKDYGGWSADVAKTEGIPFVDLNAIVVAKYQAAGQSQVTQLYFLKDHTHTTPAGAAVNAQSVVEGLQALSPDPLAAYLLPAAQTASANISLGDTTNNSNH